MKWPYPQAVVVRLGIGPLVSRAGSNSASSLCGGGRKSACSLLLPHHVQTDAPLVAPIPALVLLIHAKHLLVAAIERRSPRRCRISTAMPGGSGSNYASEHPQVVVSAVMISASLDWAAMTIADNTHRQKERRWRVPHCQELLNSGRHKLAPSIHAARPRRFTSGFLPTPRTPPTS